MSVDSRIKAEKKRLTGLFADLDVDRKKAADKLIDRAAFYVVTLEDLEATINVEGCVSEYQNGANQFGTKRSAEADLHIAMTKNLVAVMKPLIDLLPAEEKPGKKDEFLDYVSAR